MSVATSGLHDFVEPAIAASPLDPGNLVAAFFGVKDFYTSTCFFRSSRDGGATWAPGGTIATRFPDDLCDDATRTDQFFPWIAAHPSGFISLVWLDKRLDPDNVNFDLFYINTGGGQRFLPNVRISTQSSLGSHAHFIGDYNGLVVSGDAIVPVWNDARDASGVEIFTARGNLVP
ncbi:MAG TPA: hypothetical protein VGK70_07310 [Thermoanaerobaculia bacterium]